MRPHTPTPIRCLATCLRRDVQAVIFVVDSADSIRMCVAADELKAMLEHPDLRAKPRVPFLLYANKHDLPSAMDMSDVSTQMHLHTLLVDRPWHIAASNAMTGDGVDEGIAWLAVELGKAAA